MHPTYRLVALLPMKANSQRVPGKNFRSFAGQPLYKWVLQTLLKIEAIEKIVINTDAQHILEQSGIPKSDRILIRNREESLRGNTVSMNRIIENDISAIPSETYLMTHTTNPLLGTQTVLKALKEYQNGLSKGHDSLFSVNRYQTRFYRKNGDPINHDPDNLIQTQDLEPWYEENSNLYLFSKDSFARTQSRIGKKPVLFETPMIESADIDDANGWHLAEMIQLSKMIADSTHRNLDESKR